MTTEARRIIDLAISERDFQSMIVDYARLNGFRVYHTWTSRHSPSGFPDLTLARLNPTKRGVSTELVFLECKTERGRLTEAQADWLLVLNAVPGVTARMVRPSDWDEIVALLTREPRGGGRD